MRLGAVQLDTHQNSNVFYLKPSLEIARFAPGFPTLTDELPGAPYEASDSLWVEAVLERGKGVQAQP